MIPARIGSKGIPQKVIRPFNDMPLIYYSIKLALKVPNAITYLNTDSKLIKEVVENEFKSDIKIFIRDKKLGNDSVTLDELTLDFLKKTKINNGTLVTLQPTSPLLSFKSLKLSLKKFNAKNYKTLITVKENTKLEWEYDNKGDLVPTYKNRLNRQFIKPKYSETGSILISDIKETLVTKTRVNNKIGVFELNAIESIDIDSSEDWLFAESLSSSRKIVFFISANKKLGSGHLKRCLSLAFNFPSYDIYFILKNTDKEWIELVESKHYKLIIDNSESTDDFIKLIKPINPNMLVIDYLNTSEGYIKSIKKL